MSLFPDEDVLMREIETWRGFIDKLALGEDKTIMTKLLNECYNYSLAVNNQAQEHLFPSESLIMSLLLLQRNSLRLNSMLQSDKEHHHSI